MARPVTDPLTMSRLAFVRLVHMQGVGQSRLPEPLALTSLLTFHDAVELFLVLATEHLQAPPPRRNPDFLDYFHLLRASESFPAGVDLAGRQAMDRLNRHRVALKHTGATPGSAAIEDARTTVASFFEDNTPRVFAVDFDSIAMADVVPQDSIRNLLNAATAAEAADDRTEAMALLREAFTELFETHAGWSRPAASHFGPTLRTDPFLASNITGMVNALASSTPRPQDRRGVTAIGQKLGHHIEQLSKSVQAVQEGMRVLALGIDYNQYRRFEQLTPRVFNSGTENRHVGAEAGYLPSLEEFQECEQFVIETALRMAELDSRAIQPSWRVARAGAPST